MNCPVCDADSEKLATTEVLHKYTVDYYRCPNCGLIFLPDPFWLPEAYATPSDADTWRDARAEVNARILHGVFQKNNIGPTHRILDYGCGDGQLIIRMRALGYQFDGYDKYTAKTLMADTYDVITCIEVLEHLPEPWVDFELMVGKTQIIIASTELVPPRDPPIPPNWWYYTPETGQHITFYSEKSLEIIAKRYNMTVKSYGSHHVFCSAEISLAW